MRAGERDREQRVGAEAPFVSVPSSAIIFASMPLVHHVVPEQRIAQARR
jgi:hypothetical protein